MRTKFQLGCERAQGARLVTVQVTFHEETERVCTPGDAQVKAHGCADCQQSEKQPRLIDSRLAGGIHVQHLLVEDPVHMCIEALQSGLLRSFQCYVASAPGLCGQEPLLHLPFGTGLRPAHDSVPRPGVARAAAQDGEAGDAVAAADSNEAGDGGHDGDVSWAEYNRQLKKRLVAWAA